VPGQRFKPKNAIDFLLRGEINPPLSLGKALRTVFQNLRLAKGKTITYNLKVSK
jgi:hypothetical protein